VSTADLVRHIRNHGAKEWNGVRTGDKECSRIKTAVLCAHRLHAAGKLELPESARDQAKYLKSKTAVPKTRGPQLAKDRAAVEKRLMAWVTKTCKRKKRVTRTMIFREVLKMDPKWYGGKGSKGFFKKMKQWFYFGFKKRHDLSICRISGAGQKLPLNWEAKMVDLRARVRRTQMPRTIGMEVHAGVTDDDFLNTDHVPTWMEPVGDYSWGVRNSGRRTISTGGKEKNRFTTQLTISKSGKKLKPYIIFKAKPAKICRSGDYGKKTVDYEIKHRKPDANGVM